MPKIGGLGPIELIIILIVALVIFGPKNLPKLGSALGKTVKNVREGLEGKDKLGAADVDEVEVDEDLEEDEERSPKNPTPKKKATSKKN
jgi:sec-independent protein translocase protein TatA